AGRGPAIRPRASQAKGCGAGRKECDRKTSIEPAVDGSGLRRMTEHADGRRAGSPRSSPTGVVQVWGGCGRVCAPTGKWRCVLWGRPPEAPGTSSTTGTPPPHFGTTPSSTETRERVLTPRSRLARLATIVEIESQQRLRLGA